MNEKLEPQTDIKPVDDRMEAIYEQLSTSNLFIIGGVSSGKTELMGTLQRELPHVSIDVGKLFRLATHLIIVDEDEPINPDIELLKTADTTATETQRIHTALFRKTRYLEGNILEGARFIVDESDSLKFHFFGDNLDEELDTPAINELVPIVAQSTKIREVVWKWINQMAKNQGGVLLTGHNLRETDTTMYRVIHLTVSDDIAAKRLMSRQGSYTLEEAKRAVQERNTRDELKLTEDILSRVNGVIRLDTDALDTHQVAQRAIEGIRGSTERSIYVSNYLEENGIERRDFNWEMNPVMQKLRDATISRISIIGRRDVPRFDTLMQVLIHLPAFSIHELFPGSTDNFPTLMSQFVESRRGGEELQHVLSEVEVNLELLDQVILQQQSRIKHFREGSPFPELHEPRSQLGNQLEIEMIRKDGVTYIDSEDFRHMILPIGNTGRSLVFKPVDAEISSEYAHRLHYLHSERTDEFVGFGAFIDDYPYPIAWVSYSHHDRIYKMDVIQHLGIEPHNVLEMTRAWNATWSPKNTMSFLFAYANDELRRYWDELQKRYVTDKPLAGISTTINPNLGFQGSSFKGSNFSVFALRPATLHYADSEGKPVYMTRRGLEQNQIADSFDAKVPQLPLNEMLMVYNAKERKSLKKRKVYRMNKNIYKEI